MSKLLYITICLFFSITLSGEVERAFKFSVIVLDARTGDPNQRSAFFYDLNYEYDGVVLPITANVGSKSPLYAYEGAMPLTFFKEETQVNQNREEEIIRIPLVTIPNSAVPLGAERVLVILNPRDNGSFSYFIVDYSLSVLPVNNVKIVNLSGSEIAFTVGREQPQALSPGQTKTAPKAAENPYQFFMRMATQDNDQGWKLITSSFYISGPNTRQMFIVHRSNYVQNWSVQQIHALDDTVPRPDTEPEIDSMEIPGEGSMPVERPPDSTKTEMDFL